MQSPLRGDIWWLKLDPTRGCEMQKVRPVIIASLDNITYANIRLIVPITERQGWHDTSPFMIKLMPTCSNALEKPSSANVYQLRAVDMQRLVKYLGKVTAEQLDEIAAMIALYVGFQ